MFELEEKHSTSEPVLIYVVSEFIFFSHSFSDNAASTEKTKSILRSGESTGRLLFCFLFL